eukprot:10461008-Heterocapsa_arctica.AAC.1
MIRQKLATAVSEIHPECADQIIDQMLHMDNMDLLGWLDDVERLREVAEQVHINTPNTPVPPLQTPLRDPPTPPVFLLFHRCQKCGKAVGHRDKTGRHHRHCCSDCRSMGAHTTRCLRFQDEAECYEAQFKAFEVAMEAYQGVLQQEEATYLNAQLKYKEDMRNHVTRITTAEATTFLEQTS